jgi:hypothetical protein
MKGRPEGTEQAAPMRRLAGWHLYPDPAQYLSMPNGVLKK